MTSGIDYNIEFVKGVKTALFGGEGLFFATLKGPGTVWVQSCHSAVLPAVYSLQCRKMADLLTKAVLLEVYSIYSTINKNRTNGCHHGSH